ncbi:uncharacterized protein [Macrobrachium rosenbergii]|uniref:uncharacterized protein n=1 Tax=Macrobrachium rosenbergii TaxID=79674 RepID=UPI0034D4E0E7
MASIVQPLNTTIVNFSSFVGVPILSDADGNGIPTPRNIPVMLCTITLYLDVIKQQNRMNRRFADDQLFIYQYVESRLTNEYGVDGRSCLLRFICEINRFPIREWTMIGELISEVFTPREGKGSHLEAYHYAAETGRSTVGLSSCSQEYSSSCPLSVFNFFNQQEIF